MEATPRLHKPSSLLDLRNKMFSKPSGLFKKPSMSELVESEAMLTYLRLKPAVRTSEPAYLKVVDASKVVVSTAMPSRTSSLAAKPPPSAVYSFTQVYEPEADQSQFFSSVARPLVAKALGTNGPQSNSLLFCYGVSGGGKTYTIQGTPSEPGILPRTLSSIFSSIKDAHTPSQLRPTKLCSYEITPHSERQPRPPFVFDATPEFQLDSAYEYSIFLSYSEVYNEKIYDLLTPTPTARKDLSLKNDKVTGHKYVSGLSSHRVYNLEASLALIQRASNNRRVFATLLNNVSSRSHGIFTVSILRFLKGAAPEDEQAPVTCARMSIVDLAGSERAKNSATTGDRLKEAGNINKSLMVLGQCFESLRNTHDGSLRSRIKAKQIIPFRHSKLTEIFAPYFLPASSPMQSSSLQGTSGTCAIIINLSPSTTSFEEASHVLRFAASASEIAIPRSQSEVFAAEVLKEARERMPSLDEDAELSLQEEEEEDDDDFEEDPLVDMLMDEIKRLRTQLVESEVSAMENEVAVRKEVTDFWSVRMNDMARLHEKRLLEQEQDLTDLMNTKLRLYMEAVESDEDESGVVPIRASDNKENRRPESVVISSGSESDEGK